MARDSKKAITEIAKKSLLSFFTLLLFLVAYFNYKINIVPLISDQLQQGLRKYLASIFIICIALLVQRIVGGFFAWYQENITAKTATKVDDKLVPIFRRTLKVAIWVIAILIILPFYGINTSALVTTLGVSSLAIALAAQDTIANIIAGYLIMIDVPFQIGNKIKLPSGEVVEVLDIGVRRSKFLSQDKAIIIVPNVDLSRSKIINYSYGE